MIGFNTQKILHLKTNKIMNYEVCKYNGEWAVFCKASRCYVLFGSKKELIKRCKELNQ